MNINTIRVLAIFLLTFLIVGFNACNVQKAEKQSKTINKENISQNQNNIQDKEQNKLLEYKPLKGNYKVGSDGNLYLIIVNEKYGFINRQGKVVIPPQYDIADDFIDGTAKICLKYGKSDKPDNYDVKCGLIDKNGSIIAKLQYDFDDIGEPSNSLISLCLNNKCEFINNTGLEVIKSQYDFVGKFSEGLAGVCKNKRCGFIDTKGNEVINLKFNDIGTFSEGLAPVKVYNKWGLIDKTGKWIVKPIIKLPENKYESISIEPFHNGLARIKGVGFIDKKGKLVIKGHYEKFSDGLAINSGCEYFINSKGKKLLNLKNSGYGAFVDGYCTDFVEGLLLVSYNNGQKWGYLNKSGKLAIKTKATPTYDDVPPPLSFSFSEGLSHILIGEKWGFINKKGQIVIKPQFIIITENNRDFLWDSLFFRNGLAQVLTEKGYGYIDKKGNRIWWYQINKG